MTHLADVKKQPFLSEWLEPTVIVLLLLNPLVLSIDEMLATWLLVAQAVGYVVFALRIHMKKRNRLMMLCCGAATVAAAILAISVMLALPLETHQVAVSEAATNVLFISSPS